MAQTHRASFVLFVTALTLCGATGRGVHIAAQGRASNFKPAQRSTPQAPSRAVKPDDGAKPADVQAPVIALDPFEEAERLRTTDPATAARWYFLAAQRPDPRALAKLRELVDTTFGPVAPKEPPNGKARPEPVPASDQTGVRLILSALVVATAALLISVAALYVSWSHSRKALEDAGLL